MHVSWKTAAVSACAALVTATGVTTVQAAPSKETFVATKSTEGTETTLRVTLDATPGGGPQKLSRADRQKIAGFLDVSTGELVSARSGTPGAQAEADARKVTPPPAALAKKGPATLRCDKNPSWSDARGTLSARFNCHHSTINWGYKISARLRAAITGRVTEKGVSWWNNKKRKPDNAGHVVGKTYHFHGTLKPVKHGDDVQFQDHMTFRVNIGGKTGTAALTWASHVKAKK
ncbi:hypothetical protein [Streptomyces sp. NPDC088725]|uniref:hypothetical protein n=1 Tax=Streptomyces sp. NPDC088725 TaxID=3365873 RepID=UPI00380C12C8